jgi:hypothetical protein
MGPSFDGVMTWIGQLQDTMKKIDRIKRQIEDKKYLNLLDNNDTV